MTEHAVLIAGGGPTGLMLAGELALAGVDVVVVERRSTQDVDGSRALGLLSRTIEVLDQRGIAERFLDAGYVVPTHGYAGIRFDIADLPTRHNYVLALPQSQFEPILADWVSDLGVPILRDCEVEGFAQDDHGVDVDVSGDKRLRARYLVGCDGGRSLVRKTAGIDFAGLDPSTSWMIAEVAMEEEPELGFRHDSVGTHALGRPADGELIRVLLTDARSTTPLPPAWMTCMTHWSPSTERISACAVPAGSPGSPTPRGRQSRTGAAVSCWLETLPTCILHRAARACRPASKTP